MDSKRLKIDALTETRKLINDHPFELKSGKIFGQAEGHTTTLKMGALAKARQLIVDHPVQFKSGKIYIAVPIIDRAPEPAIVASPSSRPMRVGDTSRPQSQSRRNRTAEQMDEQIESSRQTTLGLLGAGHQRRQAAFKSIEQYWDYQHPCGHCGRVWLRGSSNMDS
jgi:hypothetical protein